MHRFILFAFLLVCLVSMYEAAPTPQEADNQSEMDNLKKTLQDTVENIQKQTKELIDKVNLGEAMDHMKEFFENTANKMREEAAKMTS